MKAILLAAVLSGQPQPAALPWVTASVSAPGVEFGTFESKAAKSKISYHAYLPPEYNNAPKSRFPVLYWLHGSNGGLAGIAPLSALFGKAMAEKKMPPAVIIFVNGLPEGMYVDWKDGSVPMETILIKELLPHVDKKYRTHRRREARAIEGFSMGGYGALRLGLKYPHLFRSVSSFGGGPLQEDLLNAPRAGRRRAAEILDKVYGGADYFKECSPRTLAEKNAKTIAKDVRIRVVIGERDETYPANLQFHEHLTRLKIPHEWHSLAGVRHDPLATLNGLGAKMWTFYDWE